MIYEWYLIEKYYLVFYKRDRRQNCFPKNNVHKLVTMFHSRKLQDIYPLSIGHHHLALWHLIVVPHANFGVIFLWISKSILVWYIKSQKIWYAYVNCRDMYCTYIVENVTTFDGLRFRCLISVLEWILLINKNVHTPAESFKNSPQQ